LVRCGGGLESLGHEEGPFLFPHEHREKPIQQPARRSGPAQAPVRQPLDQGHEAVPLHDVMGGDLESRKQLEAGRGEAGDYIL
jgi:hypothetical protein